MQNRREFLKVMTGAAAGLSIQPPFLYAVRQAAQDAPVKRREITVAGKRAKVIDIHAHCAIPEVGDVLKETQLARFSPQATGPQVLGEPRIHALDARGIDVQVLSINFFWWYAADRDLASQIVKVHDEKLSAWCAAHSDRFAALSSVALQFPDLAAQQLEHAVKNLGLRGAAVGGHVAGEPLSSARFDPFWAKAEELGVLVFMHPNAAENVVKDDAWKGHGDLGNIMGNPLETTAFLAHMIYDGALDRFPGLKICAAHGGGFLPSYLGRFEVACDVRPNANCQNKKHPSEYFKSQLLADSMVFSEEGIRHLVAETGPSQVVYGTDMPFKWPDTLDYIANATFLSDSEKEEVLGGTLTNLLKV
jgi:aminocarboxymuconate-semialdehyde decarboxylase